MSRSKLPKEPLFEIRKSAIQGRGAFALKRIRKGTLIAEYDGERVDNEEADRRYDEARMKRHHTFLFVISNRTVVDGAVNGNDSIYINHSCDPNCETYIERGRIFIEAIRDIPAGTELTYDYLYDRADDAKDGIEEYYKCHCGSKKCRGTILAPETEEEKAKRLKRAARAQREAEREAAKKKSRATRRKKLATR
jgi:uncharacterized protein